MLRTRGSPIRIPRGSAIAAAVAVLASTACGERRVPGELAEPRVTSGDLMYGKSLIFRDYGLGPVTDIRSGNFDADRDAEIIVVGSSGARIITPRGELERDIPFTVDNLFPVRLHRLRGGYGFLGAGLSRRPAAALMGPEGELRWRVDGSAWTAAMTLADVGEAPQAVLFRGDSVMFLDPDGGGYETKEAPPAPRPMDGLRGVQAIDRETESVLRVAAPLDTGRFAVLDFISATPRFALTRGPRDPYVLYVDPNLMQLEDERYDRIYVLASDFTSVAALPTPFARTLHAVAGSPLVMVVPAADGSDSTTLGFASLLAGHEWWDRTVLSVHRASGELIYQEVLDGVYLSVWPEAATEGTSSSFLVGGIGTLWRYTPRQ